MFTFRKQYFFLAVLLFLVEVFIALYVRDRIVRPYVGDFLVVIFLYCSIRSFWKSSAFTTAIAVLLFAYLIEILQYLNFATILGLQHSILANVILGNLFEWIDLLAYTLGIAVVLVFERHRKLQLKDGSTNIKTRNPFKVE